MLIKTRLPHYGRQLNAFWYQLSYRWQDLVIGFFFFCVYIVAVQGGLSLTRALGHSASPFWPATGIAISILVLYGYRFIPSIALGAFLMNYSLNHQLPNAFLIMIGSTLEATLGCYIILHFKKLKSTYLDELNLNIIGILLASLISPATSAAMGSLALFGISRVFSLHGIEFFLTWWIGDMIGALILVPFILRLSTVSISHFYSKRMLTFALLLLITTIVVNQLFTNQKIAPFLFVIPLLIYFSTQYFNSLYSKIFIFFLSLLLIYFSLTYTSLFPDQTFNRSLIRMQVFIATLGILHLILMTVRKNRSPNTYSQTVLLFTWVLCGGLYFYLYESNREQEKNNFLKETQIIENKIVERMRYYEDALVGGKSFFISSETINEKTWTSYIDSLQIISKYSGINGVGVITYVPRNQELAFLKKTQQEVKDFKIKNIASFPNNDRPNPPSAATDKADDLFVITYVAPLEAKASIQGLDLGSDPYPRAAAELARDTGEPTISEPIFLTRETNKKPGFILFVPIYKTKLTPTTLEARRQTLIGWIYAPFTSELLFHNILNKEMTSRDNGPFHLDVFHGSATQLTHLIFQSNNNLKKIFHSSESSVSLLPSVSLNNNEKLTKIKIGKSDFQFRWTQNANYLSNSNQDTFWVFIFGSLFSVLIYLVVYNFENTGRDAQSIAHRQTQLLLREQERVLAASKAKSEFLTNMGHEIRTPLNGIIGMINLLLRSNISENDLTKVKIISNSCDSLLNLIDDILVFSKLEANKSEAHIEPLNLYTILSDVIKLFSTKAEGKNLSISLLFQGSISEWVMGDALKLKRILSNLLGNAFKFTSKGGISIKVTSFENEDQKRFYKIEVQDTGIGIKKEALPNLFKSFSQLDASSTKLFGGTGLGLSICKSLVELLGGKIWAESEYGKGSRFIFYFNAPLSHRPHDVPIFQLVSPDSKNTTPGMPSFAPMSPSSSSTSIPPSPSFSNRPLQILVVDDNKINLKVAQMTLNKMGYECDLTDSGAEALQKMETKHYDLVLMDCFMPEMDGCSTTQQIRFKYKNTNVPRIVAVTASIMQEDHTRCLEVGMNAIIVKPIKADLLKIEIDKTLIDLTNRTLNESGIITTTTTSDSTVTAPVVTPTAKSLATNQNTTIQSSDSSTATEQPPATLLLPSSKRAPAA